jgi:hypothetical protein
VEDPLAMEMLSNPYAKNSVVSIEAVKNGLKIKIKNPEDESKVHQDYIGRVKCDVL